MQETSMDWLSLIIPVIFLTGYLFLYPYRKRGKLVIAGTFTISFVCVAVALAVVYFNEHRTNQARVFWQSISSRDNRLTIGGDYEGKNVDWGTGISKPRLELTKNSESSKLAAKLENAGAFIYDSRSQKYLNGKSLFEGGSLKTGGYKIVRNNVASLFDRFKKSCRAGESIFCRRVLMKFRLPIKTSTK